MVRFVHSDEGALLRRQDRLESVVGVPAVVAGAGGEGHVHLVAGLDGDRFIEEREEDRRPVRRDIERVLERVRRSALENPAFRAVSASIAE
jgi:hypothetical protein